MDSQKQQLIEKLQASTNILVTVSSNPSVDQLASCIGLTLLLNKIGKHATAVFSGDIPSTIEFLQPEATIEKNTDSLRDFIIALDKSKADKLRYKVEDRVVKIFITPYRTSLTPDDLEFSQGDFNVDAVVALGVHKQQDLDQAITSHGRILHDAAVMTINNTPDGELGSVNWQSLKASSLGELVAELGDDLDKSAFDEQIATALLTGIVAETERFSNEKTTPRTMSLSAELMAVGANQQLVASKLQEPAPAPAPEPVAAEAPKEEPKEEPKAAEPERPKEQPKSDDGTLEINHESAPREPAGEKPAEAPAEPKPESRPEEDKAAAPKEGPRVEEEAPEGGVHTLMTTPPIVPVSPITANIQPEGLDPSTDPLSLPPVPTELLNRHDENHTEGEHIPAPPASVLSQIESAKTTPQNPFPNASDPIGAFKPDFPPAPAPSQPAATPQPISVAEPAKPTEPSGKNDSTDVKPEEIDQTLADLEEKIHEDTEKTEGEPAKDVEAARDEVLKALNEVPSSSPEPIQALNAQPMVENLHGTSSAPAPITNPSLPPLPQVPDFEAAPGALSPADTPLDMPLPPVTGFPAPNAPQPEPKQDDPNAPPSVPPPFMPPFSK